MDRIERSFRYNVFEDDGAFVARCLDVEVASEGDTRDEAIANLQEALELLCSCEHVIMQHEGR